MSQANAEVGGSGRRDRRHFETQVATGATLRADQVCCQRLQVVQQDRRLLVPISIKLHPALLHKDAGEVFQWMKGVACEIGFHWSSSLTGVNDAGSDAGGRVLIQASAQ